MRSKLFVNNSQYSDEIADRFWNKIVNFGDCWLWSGACGKHGYGNFCVRKPEFARAHRFAYELFTGIKPTDLVCHTCDTKLCCRPDHLFEGTTQDNTDDRQSKGRSTGGIAKITHEDYEVIRHMYAQGEMSHQQIADVFAVSRKRVGDIINFIRTSDA